MDRQLISPINQALTYSGAPGHIILDSVSTIRQGTVMALSSAMARNKGFMVEPVNDSILKVGQLMDSSIYDLDKVNPWI
jgi:hypothetical protein